MNLSFFLMPPHYFPIALVYHSFIACMPISFCYAHWVSQKNHHELFLPTGDCCKDKKGNEKLIAHNGDGDNISSNNKTTSKIDSKKKGKIGCHSAADAEKIRQDDPPRMLGNKVAEVIERLLSFSTHLISIG